MQGLIWRRNRDQDWGDPEAEVEYWGEGENEALGMGI